MRQLKASTVLRLILLAMTIFFANESFSQKKKKSFIKADEMYSAGEYFKANEKYKKLFGRVKDKKLKGEVAFKLGECNKFLNIPKKAESWYRKAMKFKYADPKMYLYCADVTKMLEDYTEAAILYAQYKKLVPTDKAADIGIESCKLAADWKKKPTRHEVEEMKDINSKSSDFSPCYSRSNNKEVYFTSTREGITGEKFNEVSGLNFADIFVVRQDNKGTWSSPVPLEGDINTLNDEGAPTLNKNKINMYFTRCIKEKGKSFGCRIYTSEKNEDGWSGVEEVVLFKDSSISLGHPTISPDDLTIVFVVKSDTLGFGKCDLWMSKRDKKGSPWSKAVNMGEQLNTAGNEMYPYLKNDTSIYFASDYHPGMGGLDIFHANKNEAGIWTIENMKSPVNSAADDFALVFKSDADEGLFTSSRNGTDDLFSFALPQLEFALSGFLFDEKTNKFISGGKVKLLDDKGESIEATTGRDGSFAFRLKPNTDYIIIGSKEKYFTSKAQETTKNLTVNKNFSTKLFLMPTNIVIELPNIEYDYNSDKLRDISKVSLDKLIETLTDNPNITIELRSHTDFRGDSEKNLDLSQRRAQSVVNYLVTNGIEEERLSAIGFGEAEPKLVTTEMAKNYPFLKMGDILDEKFINALKDETQKETSHQMNRRTEFKVVSENFVPKN